MSLRNHKPRKPFSEGGRVVSPSPVQLVQTIEELKAQLKAKEDQLQSHSKSLNLNTAFQSFCYAFGLFDLLSSLLSSLVSSAVCLSVLASLLIVVPSIHA